MRYAFPCIGKQTKWQNKNSWLKKAVEIDELAKAMESNTNLKNTIQTSILYNYKVERLIELPFLKLSMHFHFSKVCFSGQIPPKIERSAQLLFFLKALIKLAENPSNKFTSFLYSIKESSNK